MVSNSILLNPLSEESIFCLLQGMENLPSALSNVHKLSQFLILQVSCKWALISSQSGPDFWRDPSTLALKLSCGILCNKNISKFLRCVSLKMNIGSNPRSLEVTSCVDEEVIRGKVWFLTVPWRLLSRKLNRQVMVVEILPSFWLFDLTVPSTQLLNVSW